VDRRIHRHVKAVPLYSLAVARLRRGVFIPLVNRFFALNLVAFYAALVLLPESARTWIDRVFYVWLSVFALFVVAVFWGLVVDLFRDDQGKRLWLIAGRDRWLGKHRRPGAAPARVPASAGRRAAA
jgi:hypothetical protein